MLGARQGGILRLSPADSSAPKLDELTVLPPMKIRPALFRPACKRIQAAALAEVDAPSPNLAAVPAAATVTEPCRVKEHHPLPNES